MSDDKIKMSYSQNQLRVRFTFRASFCLEVSEPPSSIIKRATSKLSNEQYAGNLDFFEIFDDGLRDLWQRIRLEMKNPGAKDLWVTYTIGCGAPRIHEIVVEKPESDKAALYLTFKGQPAFAKNWTFDFVRINVRQQMRILGLVDRPNDAHLFSCWLRAIRGESIVRKPIGHYPKISEIDPQKGFAVVGNKTRHEVTVTVVDEGVFKDTTRMQNLVTRSAKAVSKMQAMTGTPMEFLKVRLIDRLKSALHGPERFGVGIPALYLVGYPSMPQKSDDWLDQEIAGNTIARHESSEEYRATKELNLADTYPGKGLLPIIVEDGGMRAYVGRFDQSLYDHPEFAVDIEWVEREVRNAGVVFGFSDQFRQEIEKAINAGANLEGQTLAVGLEPSQPQGAYLWEAFKESRIVDLSANINMRESQQRTLVATGDLVAEVRYEVEAVAGTDVLGRPIAPSKGEKLDISIGDGIELREDGRYYATFDGVPEVKNNSIYLNRVFVHIGDVNLRSGNIRFDGPVEIKGAIDSGATVEVTGDLIVHGTIRDANVRVGGSLTTKSGIITGNRGLIRVRNDIFAEFMENSRVICGGNVFVKRVILNTNLVAGGSIEVDRKSGVVAGGRVSCRKYLRTGKLGFPKGALTKVFAGVDWRAKVAVEIREDRLQKIVDVSNNDRNALRELTRRKQKTKKQIEKIENLHSRLKKARGLIEKMRNHLQKASSEMNYDPDARIFVHGTLYANINVEVAGVPIPVTHDVVEVEISPKRQRGAHIHALEEGSELGDPESMLPSA